MHCALTLHLWLFHCFASFSFHWQLSALSSPLTPVSHDSFSCIGWFHFPHRLLPIFFHPIFPLVPYQDPLPVRVLSALQRPTLILLPSSRRAWKRPRQDLEWQSMCTSKTHKTNTKTVNSSATKLWPQKWKCVDNHGRQSCFGGVGEWDLVRAFQALATYSLTSKGSAKRRHWGRNMDSLGWCVSVYRGTSVIF